jgi:hypothetical protein
MIVLPFYSISVLRIHIFYESCNILCNFLIISWTFLLHYSKENILSTLTSNQLEPLINLNLLSIWTSYQLESLINLNLLSSWVSYQFESLISLNLLSIWIYYQLELFGKFQIKASELSPFQYKKWHPKSKKFWEIFERNWLAFLNSELIFKLKIS